MRQYLEAFCVRFLLTEGADVGFHVCVCVRVHVEDCVNEFSVSASPKRDVLLLLILVTMGMFSLA